MNRVAGMPDKRIAWLDLFRGMAAITVVLFHLRDYLGIPWMSFGFLAVDLFFVLSGIVLSLRYSDAIARGMSFPKFAQIRLDRLYPMAFIAGMFVLLLNVIHVPPGVCMIAVDRFVWTIFLITPLPWSQGRMLAFPANLPMWSLWAELVANVIWFAVMRIGRRLMPVVAGMSIAGTLALTWHLGTINYGWRSYAVDELGAVLRAFACFGAGYAIACGRMTMFGSVWHWALALAAAIGLYDLFPTSLVAYSVIAIGTLLLAALYRASPPPALIARVSSYLGSISYPLYLIHVPSGRLLPYLDTAMPRWVAALLVIGTAAVLATLLNEVAVITLQRWRKRRASRRMATLTGTG